MTKNHLLASLFDEMADILEFLGESPFRARAFRSAARGLDASSEDVETLAEQGRLREIQGVGEGIGGRIAEYLEHGSIEELEKLRKSVPSGLLALSRIQGIGPKTVLLVHERLGVTSVPEMKAAVESGALAGLPGMGAKKIENIRKGIEIFEQGSGTLYLPDARRIADAIVGALRRVPGIQRIEVAGSLRRWKEVIGDIDIVCSARDAKPVLDTFTALPGVLEVLGRGPTKASVRGDQGRQVDLRVVPDESYGAALQYFTGSKAHNIKVRDIARDRGLKINEYGVFKGEDRIAGMDEEEVYASVGLPWIPPEIREDTGEIEAARGGRLEPLVTLRDVRGDLHAHSDWSDGSMSIQTLAERAKERGYSFIVVSDHSRAASYAGGLTPERLLRQWEAIETVRRFMKGIEIFAASEVDILADGTLDFPDEILERLDWVIASIHSGFKQNVTERILRAMENPLVDVIAHPTGRLLGKRAGYEVDLEKVIEQAARTGTALEINGFPDRLDLSDVNTRRASERGVRITLGTDTHHAGNLEYMEYAVQVARRAGLAPKHVVNCLTSGEIRERRKRRMRPDATPKKDAAEPATSLEKVRSDPPAKRPERPPAARGVTPRRGGSRGRSSTS